MGIGFLMLASDGAAQQKVVMEIEGMTCELCTVAVKKSLSDFKGVAEVKVSYPDKKAWLIVTDSITDRMLEDAVQRSGSFKGKVVERQAIN
jgi:mercuric ion binding protein